MTKAWRTTLLLATIAVIGLLDPPDARGDFRFSGNFGPNGDVGFTPGTSPPNLSITFGDGQGSIYQMDGFVNVPGKDLGSGVGVSADLVNGAPTGLGYTFSDSQPTAHQLLLNYTFVNNTGSVLNNFQFLHFVDADIGPNFADESAKVNGDPGLPNPTSYQVGDPTLSTIFTNLLNGTLSNVNEQPPGSRGDVSIAVGFTIASLGIGQSISYNILLSDDETHLGQLFVTQTDPVYTGDRFTVSGAVVPEPSSLMLITVGGLVGLGYRFRRRLSPHAWTRSQ